MYCCFKKIPLSRVYPAWLEMQYRLQSCERSEEISYTRTQVWFGDEILVLALTYFGEKTTTAPLENKMLPQVFDNYFRKPSHQYGTRFALTQNNFVMIRITSATEKSLLKYIAPKIWANIPIHIKDAPSLKVFIKFYRNHLIGNYVFKQNVSSIYRICPKLW